MDLGKDTMACNTGLLKMSLKEMTTGPYHLKTLKLFETEAYQNFHNQTKTFSIKKRHHVSRSKSPDLKKNTEKQFVRLFD